MKDPRGIWLSRLADSYRFTFQIEEDRFIMRRIGTHDILKKPLSFTKLKREPAKKYTISAVS